MAKADALYQVKESFSTSLRGQEVAYQKGELVTGDDPAYRKFPHLFESLTIRGQPVVEQATAAPGEKRRLSVRRKPRKATAAEETAIAATIEAEAEPEPEGKAITTDSFRGR